MSRDSIHQRIDDLLTLISNQNSRLSLHTQKLSQLDIDVLRKQCIDLYDEVNKLALQGKRVTNTTSQQENEPIAKVASTPKSEEKAEVPPTSADTIPESEIKISHAEVPAIESKNTATQKPEDSKSIASEKANKSKTTSTNLATEEILSLFQKFSSTPIDSISKGMSLAKRFEFQSAFFDGDRRAYNEFIAALENAENREAAFEIYHAHKDKYEWENEELKDELKALIYRKHTE